MTFDASVATRLREERDRLKLSQAALAEAVGVRREMWARYEGGTEPGAGVLIGAVKAGVDVLYVLTGQRGPNRPALADLPLPATNLPALASSPDPVRPDTTQAGAPQRGALASNVGGALVAPADVGFDRPLTLPVRYGAGQMIREYQVIPKFKADASAGVPGARQLGADELQADVAGVLALEVDYMRRALGRDGAGFITVQVAGDSMEPTLAEGDLIIVDTTRTSIDASGIYVVELQGDLLVKRVQRNMDGSLVLMSDNRAYQPETIQAGAAHTLRVLGRMTRLRVR